MAQLNRKDRAQLREFLADRFNLSEMKTLCFDLGVDYEEFPHATKSEFSRELLAYFERKNKVGCLIAEMVQQRQDSWLTEILVQVSSCQPNQKVQVILSNDKIKSRPDLRQKLADLLGISTDEVMLIATAPGSVKVLLGLPPEAIAKLAALSLPHQLGEYELVEVTPYNRLPPVVSTGWRTAVLSAATASVGRKSGGLTLSLIIKIFFGLVFAIVVGGGVLLFMWQQSLPKLVIHNRCDAPFPIEIEPDVIKTILSLPDEIPPNEPITVDVLTGSGAYRVLERDGELVLRLPNPIPLLGDLVEDFDDDELPLGSLDPERPVFFDGRLLEPDTYNIEADESYDLFICEE
ncbi:hypothetical protein [Candidatus Leptofilum sp.]|uniref:hypothetical protein n=1 Tax=Candidatus Leptofilum sp. TaxID=3241576 RepID=UPI003B594399